MGKNNICVIYDSDENYAKRLMSIIMMIMKFLIMHRYLQRKKNLTAIFTKKGGCAYDK